MRPPCGVWVQDPHCLLLTNIPPSEPHFLPFSVFGFFCFRDTQWSPGLIPGSVLWVHNAHTFCTLLEGPRHHIRCQGPNQGGYMQGQSPPCLAISPAPPTPPPRSKFAIQQRVSINKQRDNKFRNGSFLASPPQISCFPVMLSLAFPMQTRPPTWSFPEVKPRTQRSAAPPSRAS